MRATMLDNSVAVYSTAVVGGRCVAWSNGKHVRGISKRFSETSTRDPRHPSRVRVLIIRPVGINVSRGKERDILVALRSKFSFLLVTEGRVLL